MPPRSDTLRPKRLYWNSDFSPALEHVSFPQAIDALFQLGWPVCDLTDILHDNLTRVIRGSRAGQPTEHSIPSVRFVTMTRF